jgi:epoxide hydrolase
MLAVERSLANETFQTTRRRSMSDVEATTPFTLHVDQAQLDDLDRRLEQTRWPQELPDAGWDYGMRVDYLRELVEHWRTRYDWRAHEAQINAQPNFTTTIDGQRVHFIRARADAEKATPLILSHGWPGSIVEFLPMVAPLSDAGFHLVIPSLPGFGLSGPSGFAPRCARRRSG